jgi:hypothetical protein
VAFSVKENRMTDMTDFELSRVYARGWNAGRKALAEGRADSETFDIDKANPYETFEARARWATGFGEALQDTRGQKAGASRHLTKAPQEGASQRHRFQIGQVVSLSESMYERKTTSESFKISRLLPIENGIAQYRIKSLRDDHERVANESRLTVSASAQ